VVTPMPDWFKLYRTFSSNSKIQRLRRSVNATTVREDAISDVLVQGMVVRLWLWCNDRTIYVKKTKHRDGSLNNGYIFSASKINDAEYAIGWSGEPGGFIKSCIECGLIDDLGGENGEHRYQIHNWERYAGALMDAMRKRVSGVSPGNVQDNPGCSGMFPTSSPLLSSSLLSSSLIKDSNTKVGTECSVEEVYAHYRSYHERAAPVVSKKDRALIQAAIHSGRTVQDCCEAIDGYHRSPYHLGLNDRNTKYLGLGLIFRDADHITKGIEMAHDELLTSMKGGKGLAGDLMAAKSIEEFYAERGAATAQKQGDKNE
jgi:hypothetical protein